MNRILAGLLVIVFSFIQKFADGQNFQSIQNAGPLNVDLSNPSFAGIQSDPGIEEHKLGGYRPLYPPYFVLGQQPPAGGNYRDRDYYTRGGQQQQQQQRQRQIVNGLEFARVIPAAPPAPLPAIFPASRPRVRVETFAFASASSNARSVRFPTA